MAKKRGKVKAKSKKKNKKSGDLRTSVKKFQAEEPMKDSLRELEILAEEKKVGQKVEDMGKTQYSIVKKEDKIVVEETKLEKETEKLQKLENEIKEEVSTKPLTTLSFKDLNKGIIGAFIGVVAHFAFIYGKTIATQISILRATVLLVFSYILITILMYETGYREIKEKRLLGILPKRATVIYVTSILMIPIIFFLFNQLNLTDIGSLYKEIAVTSVLASVGAGTADLIGRH